MQKEILFVGGIQQTEFNTILLIDAATGNNLMRQQRVANITSYKCGHKGYYWKDCPNSVGTSPMPNQTLSIAQCQLIVCLLW